MKTLLVLGHSFVRRVADKIDKDSLDLGGDIDNIRHQVEGSSATRWCTFKCERDPVIFEKHEKFSEKIWSEMKK